MPAMIVRMAFVAGHATASFLMVENFMPGMILPQSDIFPPETTNNRLRLTGPSWPPFHQEVKDVVPDQAEAAQ